MKKRAYTSPELEILRFDPEEIIAASVIVDPIPGDGVVDDDNW